jgi:hypothetical protein
MSGGSIPIRHRADRSSARSCRAEKNCKQMIAELIYYHKIIMSKLGKHKCLH